MPLKNLQKDQIRQVFSTIKPYFKEKLGKYTHQRVSGDWHFHGLGFVNGNMTYVFGINIGFFKKEASRDYSHVGMNVLVRTNGVNKDLRQKYKVFFKKVLKNWVFENEKIYTSERGGVGTEFPRYKSVNELNTEEDVLDFFKSCIDGMHEVYREIYNDKSTLFDNVLRAAPPWDESILEICEDALGIDSEE